MIFGGFSKEKTENKEEKIVKYTNENGDGKVRKCFFFVLGEKVNEKGCF